MLANAFDWELYSPRRSRTETWHFELASTGWNLSPPPGGHAFPVDSRGESTPTMHSLHYAFTNEAIQYLNALRYTLQALWEAWGSDPTRDTSSDVQQLEDWINQVQAHEPKDPVFHGHF